MSSDQPRRRESSGSPGSPMGSTAAIIIAIVAVVAGFLILRSIGDDDDGGDALTPSSSTTPDTTPASVTTPTSPPSTTPPSTTFVPVTEGATAVVANASTVNGAAGRLTTALLGKNFTMGEATNATVKVEDSLVYYDDTDPEALDVANSIAFYMGGIEVQPMPSPP
ncbi:MAG: LytR C-terminal domain-containing protein, partial [Ilumatobacteraceae bacterium]